MAKLTIEANVEEVLDKQVTNSKTNSVISMSQKHKGKHVKVLVLEGAVKK